MQQPSTPLPSTLAQPSKWTSSTGEPVCARYEILTEVGRGGMGVVYRARHRHLGKEVALKITLPGAPVERFLREARLLSQISSPHVVMAHDFDVLADGCPMLVMEWVDGTDLARMLRESGPLEEGPALLLMRQVATGMLAAAEQGIIHRDLKPSNILIDRQGRARVADFGLARGSLDMASLSLSGSLMGTPHYMAPEQAETPRSVDTRADVYSFGATFYHALTGSVPFEGESVFSILFRHKTEPLVAPRARRPELSERSADLLEHCLAKSPADRFPSFADLLRHLEPTPAAACPWEEKEDSGLAPYLARYRQRRGHYLTPSAGERAADLYEFPGGRLLRVLHGNIVDQDVDAVVSSDDEFLSMGGGVSQAIRAAAGPAFMDVETQKYVPVRPGRAVVTPAGRLKARFIFHGITLAFGEAGVLWPSRDLIVEILHICIYHADTLRVQSLALPLLGTGVGRFSTDVCLDTMFPFLSRALLRGLTSLREARIVLFR